MTKEFLDGELAKYESYLNVNKFINVKDLFSSDRQFKQCKQQGVGQTTILKFLGGNWTDYMIREALVQLRDIKNNTPLNKLFGWTGNNKT